MTSKPEKFEMDIINNCRDFLILATGKGFWHIFIGDEIVMSEETPNESLIQVELPK